MERWAVKLLAMLVLFIVPFLCTILPIKLHRVFVRKGQQGQRVLSWLMCFGGGVFLATFMLDMAPEVRSILNRSLLEPLGITYPLPDLIMIGGFFLILIIEKTALRALSARSTHSHTNHDNHDGEASMKLNPLPNNDSDTTNSLPSSEPQTHGHSHGTFENSSRSIILALALSLHRIFEGMSLGLKHTVLGVMNLCLAMMCHETVIGFSLGLQFVRNGFPTKKTLISAFLCSIIMPIGVAIGTVIVEMGDDESVAMSIVNGVLQAISCGTFIYVTFFEILQDEITHSDTSLGKIFSLMVGFALMAALVAIPEPEEVTAEPVVMTTVSSAFTEVITYIN